MAASRNILGSPGSMNKHLAISSCVFVHLLAKPFCFGVSSMLSFSRMSAFKHYIMNCSERNSFCFVVPSFVYLSANTMQNRNPDSECTPKVPSYLWTQRLFSLGHCHSWYWGLCDLGQYAHIAYITEFPYCLWGILDHIRSIQMTQSIVPLPWTVGTQVSSRILKRCKVSKTFFLRASFARVRSWSFTQSFLF